VRSNIFGTEDDEAIRNTLHGAEVNAEDIELEVVNKAEIGKGNKGSKALLYRHLGPWYLESPI
jgi:hypothetical protein